MLRGCGPTGSEAGDGTAVGEAVPDLVEHFAFQALHLLRRQDRELLIGGRLNIERYLFLAEELLQLHCRVDCMPADAEIELVGKERVELNA